jgi:hypothetical protein
MKPTTQPTKLAEDRMRNSLFSLTRKTISLMLSYTSSVKK